MIYFYKTAQIMHSEADIRFLVYSGANLSVPRQSSTPIASHVMCSRCSWCSPAVMPVNIKAVCLLNNAHILGNLRREWWFLSLIVYGFKSTNLFEYWHCSCVVTEFDPIVFFPFRAQNANFPNSRCENTPLIGRESPPPSVSVVFPVKAPHKNIQCGPLHQRKNWRTKLETVSFIQHVS